MTAPCGAQTRDVHGDVICDLESGHRGAHSGEVVGGVSLRWSAAPPLSAEERAVVQRFEAADDALLEDEIDEVMDRHRATVLARARRSEIRAVTVTTLAFFAYGLVVLLLMEWVKSL